MKEIEETIEKVEKRKAFIAADGTRFADKEQCRKYEESAYCVVKSRLNFLGTSNIYGLFGEGSEDCDIEVIDCKSEEDADNIVMYANLAAERSNIERSRIKAGKPIILFYDYDRSYCWIKGDGTLDCVLMAIKDAYQDITNK